MANDYDYDDQYIIDVKEHKLSILKIKEHYSDEDLLEHIDIKKIEDFLNKKTEKN